MMTNDGCAKNSTTKTSAIKTAEPKKTHPIILPETCGVVGNGMLKNNVLLAAALKTHIQRWYPWSKWYKPTPLVFLGWGQKKSHRRAKKWANQLGVRVMSVEDGFLRSLEAGIHSRHALSFVVDDLGMYFDLSRPSRLEQLILQRQANWCEDNQQTAAHLIQQLIAHQLSKYNHSQYCPDLTTLAIKKGIIDKVDNTCEKGIHILVIDQVQGDLSIQGAGATAKTFEKMLRSALQQHPNACIWIKSHPAGKKGYFNNHQSLPNRVIIIDEAVNPIALLKQVSQVYTVSSHMGFEALMLGKTVHCFGATWYGGWGLTKDHYPNTQLKNAIHARRQAHQEQFCGQVSQVNENKANLWQLFWAAYIDYSHYVDPASGQPCDIQTAINWLVTNRIWYQRLRQSSLTQPSLLKVSVVANQKNSMTSTNQLSLYEFSAWKIPFVKSFIDMTNLTVFIKPKSKTLSTVQHTLSGFAQKSPLSQIAKVTKTAKTAQNQSFVYRRFLDKKNGIKQNIKGIQQGIKPAFTLIKTLTPIHLSPIKAKSLAMYHHLCGQYPEPWMVWGLSAKQRLQNHLAKHHKPEIEPIIWCMEDGFIRSNGLGATLLAPLSVVLDRLGIYYNALQPSDLETMLLQCPPLTDQQKKRVQQLHQQLLSYHVSKYNVGQKNQHKLMKLKQQAAHQKIMLVIGQVEDDLSIRYCGSHIKSNQALIERVRADNPKAILWYKPHPDVEAGLRNGKVPKSTLALVDGVLNEISIIDCLNVVDEVHTISSLTGFEALLREKTVVCYGLPFYAGWGLTIEKDEQYHEKAQAMLRRQRTEPLHLNQLIDCALIRYPLYKLPNGYGLAQVEQVIEFLYVQQQQTFHHKKSSNTQDGGINKGINSGINSVINTHHCSKKYLLSHKNRLKRKLTTQIMKWKNQWVKPSET